MDASAVASQLLAALGGRENVLANDACMTRLRVGVRDRALVDVDAIRQVDGVMGVVDADTLQIVFGPGTVNKVLEAFVAVSGVPRGSDRTAADVARQNRESAKARQTGPAQLGLKRLANVFVPLLPGVIAAGLINGLANVANVASGGALGGRWWFECVRTMGWAPCS